jgi:hypothetical protein
VKSHRSQGADVAVAESVIGWATAHPHIQVTGGVGLSYPSITIAADTGRSRARLRGVLSLYGSPPGEPPGLEVRVKRMCRMPPYNRTETRKRLTEDLRALHIPRLDAEPVLADKRPNIPLSDLTGGRIERLLAIIDHWIDNIRVRATEPENPDQTED